MFLQSKAALPNFQLNFEKKRRGLYSMWALYRVIYFVSFFLFFQLLKLFSRDSQAAPHFGFNPTSSLPCLRLKYRNTQRTTSPVIIFLFCSFSVERCTTDLMQSHHLQALTEQISGPQSYLLHKGRVVSTVCPRLVGLASHTSTLLHCAKAMEVKFSEVWQTFGESLPKFR